MQPDNQDWIFHLAIPVHDLAAAENFYADFLGCRVARRYDDRITLEFYRHQVVCHLDPAATPKTRQLYPRHFGVTFRHRRDFDELHQLVRACPEFIFKDRFVRFGGLREEHHSFCLVDPSNNILEFKYYPDPEMMY